MKNICNDYHRFFVASEGTVEGLETVKIWVVVVCTACKESYLIEHIMDKSSTNVTKKENK